mmetsp:Transcript_4499/g.18080  ORF Transcript_4499/g.18080 Transcript_4499/m.18080 type:complete len:205 (+) Transcript_4499:931-1545(+)
MLLQQFALSPDALAAELRHLALQDFHHHGEATAALELRRECEHFLVRVHVRVVQLVQTQQLRPPVHGETLLLAHLQHSLRRQLHAHARDGRAPVHGAPFQIYVEEHGSDEQYSHNSEVPIYQEHHDGAHEESQERRRPVEIAPRGAPARRLGGAQGECRHIHGGVARQETDAQQGGHHVEGAYHAGHRTDGHGNNQCPLRLPLF